MLSIRDIKLHSSCIIAIWLSLTIVAICINCKEIANQEADHHNSISQQFIKIKSSKMSDWKPIRGKKAPSFPEKSASKSINSKQQFLDNESTNEIDPTIESNENTSLDTVQIDHVLAQNEPNSTHKNPIEVPIFATSPTIAPLATPKPPYQYKPHVYRPYEYQNYGNKPNNYGQNQYKSNRLNLYQQNNGIWDNLQSINVIPIGREKLHNYIPIGSYDKNHRGKLQPIDKNMQLKRQDQTTKKLFHREPMINLLPITTSTTTSRVGQHLLPSGPPPFKPMQAFLVNLASLMQQNEQQYLSNSDLLLPMLRNRMKKTKIYKQFENSPAQYFFLDILKQLSLLCDKLAHTQVKFVKWPFKLHLFIETLVEKVGKNMVKNKNFGHSFSSQYDWPKTTTTTKNKHGFLANQMHSMKDKAKILLLKWPIVMLNPRFLPSLLQDPTFLVSLFNTVETAYLSMPHKLHWLKPIVRLVTQPNFEKEEQIWWRRKRHYDLLNGPQSSELEPNLQTKHFRTIPMEVKRKYIANSSSPTKLIVPALIGLTRKLMHKKAPQQQHYKYPRAERVSENPVQNINPKINNNNNNNYDDNNIISQMPIPIQLQESHQSPEIGLQNEQPALANNLHTSLSSHRDLLTQEEFDSLEPEHKRLILEESRRQLEEAKFTDDLIKQHTDFIESFTMKKLNLNTDNDNNNNNDAYPFMLMQQQLPLEQRLAIN